MLDRLQGKKTYIVAGATVVFAVLGLVLGQLEPTAVGQLIALALTGAGLKSAIKKAE